MKDYTETVLVEFDPQELSYQQLLDVFWDSHDPTYDISGRQYRNAVFYTSENQRIEAEKSRQQVKVLKKRAIFTAIEKAGEFYPAEDYHQKYYLRSVDKLFNEFSRIYPEGERFAASSAAARINGYLGCNGQPEDLKKDLGSLGLSAQTQNYLVDYVTTACSRFEGMTCPAPKMEE
jgi:hypothetical protein